MSSQWPNLRMSPDATPAVAQWDAPVVEAEPQASAPSSPRLRLAFALLLMSFLMGFVLVAAEWEPRLLPIRVVSVDGELHGPSRESLRRTVTEQIDGGILSQDLSALQQAVEALPWVEQVEVRRQWPDRLVLLASEHEPLARWGDDALVSAKGEVFRPAGGALPKGLAQLRGPDESALLLVSRYRDWDRQFATLGLVIETLERDARGDWRIGLLGGTLIHVGTQEPDIRLARLLRAYPELESIAAPASIDLRYNHGFAVRWEPTANSDARIERLAANNRQVEK